MGFCEVVLAVACGIAVFWFALIVLHCVLALVAVALGFVVGKWERWRMRRLGYRR